MNGGLLSAFVVRQREVIPEGAVDEFGPGIGVEQTIADVDLVEGGGQPCRGRVPLALPSERVHHPPPQQPGDHGGAAGGQGQQPRCSRGWNRAATVALSR